MKRCSKFVALLILFAIPFCLPGRAQGQPGAALTPRQLAGVDQFMVLKLQEATTALDQGNYAKAEAIVDAVTLLYPEKLLREQTKALKAQCIQKRIEKTLLEGTVLVEKPIYTSGEQAVITFRLRNIGKNPIQIPTHHTVEERFLLPDEVVENNRMHIQYAEITRTVRTVSSERQTQFLTFDEPIELAAGEEWERSFEFDTTQRSAAEGIISTVEVVGTFLPLYVQRTTQVQRFARFRFEPAVVIVLPVGWEDHVDKSDPLGSLLKGIETKAPAAIFYAAALLPPEQRETALKSLIVGLADTEPRSAQGNVMMSALSQISGLYLRQDRERWLAWWKNRVQEPNRKESN